jgi:hypothetical protein
MSFAYHSNRYVYYGGGQISMRANAPCINLFKKLQLIKSLLQLILVQGQSSVVLTKIYQMDFEENYFRLMSYLPITKLHILQFWAPC